MDFEYDEYFEFIISKISLIKYKFKREILLYNIKINIKINKYNNIKMSKENNYSDSTNNTYKLLEQNDKGFLEENFTINCL